MRSTMATLLSLLVVVWPLPLGSQAGSGTISGVVSIDGRPLAGASLALVDLDSGTVQEVLSGASGAYEVRVAPGDYTVSTRGPAGLAVARGPIRVHVGPGQTALADVDLIALPVAELPEAQTPTPQEPLPESTGDAPPAQEPAADGALLGGDGPATTERPVVEVPAPEGGAAIRFDKVECFVAGEYPLLDAELRPAASVARARVFFRSAQNDEWFFIEMGQTPEALFQGKLPRPRLEASPITYYLQATTTSFVDSQSPEVEAIVVRDKDECRDKLLAPFGTPGPVQVFSAQSGAVITPAGFAAGGLLTAGVIAAVVGGAAAIGVGSVIINNPQPTPTPIPPTPPPTPAPTPTPPVPTPSPLPTPSPIPRPPPVSGAR